jgi:hypothetical protein
VLRFFIINLFFLLSVTELHSQTEFESLSDSANKWFISASVGAQMSGIKDEDFVSSNYSPLINITFGRRISPLLAFHIGIKGFYFNYIADESKHNYSFVYLGSSINLINLAVNSRNNKDWNLLIHTSLGIFNNILLNKLQGCINIGIQNNYSISESIEVSLDIASIIGWKIYQGDEDILPGVSFGIIYTF